MNRVSDDDRSTLLSFVSCGASQGYAPQSGEIIGILTVLFLYVGIGTRLALTSMGLLTVREFVVLVLDPIAFAPWPGASPDRWGHGAHAGQKRTPPGRGDSVSVLVSPSHHNTSRLWTLAQDITLEWEQRKKRRFGGGAPCESRKTVFCVPCPVASDSCDDQASAWLLGDVAETEQSSSVAGVRVTYLFFMLCMHHLSLFLSLLKVFFFF